MYIIHSRAPLGAQNLRQIKFPAYASLPNNYVSQSEFLCVHVNQESLQKNCVCQKMPFRIRALANLHSMRRKTVFEWLQPPFWPRGEAPVCFPPPRFFQLKEAVGSSSNGPKCRTKRAPPGAQDAACQKHTMRSIWSTKMGPIWSTERARLARHMWPMWSTECGPCEAPNVARLEHKN